MFSTRSPRVYSGAMEYTNRESSVDKSHKDRVDGVSCRLLNTVRQGDFYILTDDFDSCTSFLWLSESIRVQRLTMVRRHSRTGNG
jgi:hypothetical protein